MRHSLFAIRPFPRSLARPRIARENERPEHLVFGVRGKSGGDAEPRHAVMVFLTPHALYQNIPVEKIDMIDKPLVELAAVISKKDCCDERFDGSGGDFSQQGFEFSEELFDQSLAKSRPRHPRFPRDTGEGPTSALAESALNHQFVMRCWLSQGELGR